MPRVYVSNIGDAEVRDNGAYVPGNYTFEIVGASLDSSQRTGRECLKTELSIIEGPDDESGNNVEGRPFAYRVWMPMAGDPADKEATMKGMLRGFFDKIGMPYDDEGFDPDDAVGLTFSAKLAAQKDRPEYLEIKRVL